MKSICILFLFATVFSINVFSQIKKPKKAEPGLKKKESVLPAVVVSKKEKFARPKMPGKPYKTALLTGTITFGGRVTPLLPPHQLPINKVLFVNVRVGSCPPTSFLPGGSLVPGADHASGYGFRLTKTDFTFIPTYQEFVDAPYSIFIIYE